MTKIVKTDFRPSTIVVLPAGTVDPSGSDISGTIAAIPLTAPLGVDGVSPASAANPVPVTMENSSITITGPVTVSNEVEIKNDTGNPVPVSTPLAAPVVGQYKVTATATAIGSGALVNGVVVKAKSTNAGTVWVGGSGVTTTDDGTGNGFALAAGDAVSFSVSNLSAIYAKGTANDVLYFAGN